MRIVSGSTVLFASLALAASRASGRHIPQVPSTGFTTSKRPVHFSTEAKRGSYACLQPQQFSEFRQSSKRTVSSPILMMDLASEKSEHSSKSPWLSGLLEDSLSKAAKILSKALNHSRKNITLPTTPPNTPLSVGLRSFATDPRLGQQLIRDTSFCYHDTPPLSPRVYISPYTPLNKCETVFQPQQLHDTLENLTEFSPKWSYDNRSREPPFLPTNPFNSPVIAMNASFSHTSSFPLVSEMDDPTCSLHSEFISTKIEDTPSLPPLAPNNSPSVPFNFEFTMLNPNQLQFIDVCLKCIQ